MGDTSTIDTEYPRFNVDGLDSKFLNWLQGNFESAQAESNSRVIVNQISTAGAATPASTVETTLFSGTIPAGSFVSDGCSFKLTAFGTTNSNANTKRLRAYLGGVLVLDTSTFSGTGKSWDLEISLSSVAPSTQDMYGRAIINGQNPIANFTSLTQDMTIDQTLTITGLNGTANAGDIQLKAIKLETSLQ